MHASQHLVSFVGPSSVYTSAIFTGYEYSESCGVLWCSIDFVLWWFVPVKGWNCGYIHGFVFVQEKGVKLTVYSWLSVPEKGWKSGTFMSFWLDSDKYLCTIGFKFGQYSYQYCYISFEVFFKLLEAWADIGYNPKHDVEGGPEPKPGSRVR